MLLLRLGTATQPKNRLCWTQAFVQVGKQFVMINRRRFMQSLAVASAAPINTLAQSNDSPLKPDPDGIIDLPEGWQYTGRRPER